jgi:hypothetical protein
MAKKQPKRASERCSGMNKKVKYYSNIKDDVLVVIQAAYELARRVG